MSPFSTTTNTTLSQELGHTGSDQIIDQLLNGEYIIGEDILQRHDSKELSNFIDSLTGYGREIDMVNPIISGEDLRDIFHHTNEKTSSSPSGVHMGIWKAATAIEDIADMLAASTTLPFLYGFSKQRWKRSLHVMLAKLDKPYIHKLRIVQLFEADFNAALKILYSRRMMENSEKYRLNPDQVYASRKGNTVHDCLVNLQLTYEISHSTRSVMAILFNDMAGCYDRLRFNLINITTRRLGMHPNVNKAHNETLSEMVHNVRTANGDSDESFQATKDTGGTGQGSGGSPPLCHSQLVTMVATMSKLTPGQLLQDPTKTIRVLQHVINWVDDTINKECLQREDDMTRQITKIRDILVKWRRILRITGGDLELSKTVVYYLDHVEEKNGRTRLKTIEESPGDIIMPIELPKDEAIFITRREPHQAERYLGIRVAPDGQMCTEYQFQIDQAKQLGEKLARIQMTRPESTIAYQSRWLSLVGFFSPITTFTHKQCEDIQKPIYKAILPKMGYNCHIRLAIRYGPVKYGGIGLVNLATEQALKHVQYIVGTIRQSTELADTIIISLSTIQLQAGVEGLFLNKSRNQIPYLHGNSRIFYLWNVCNEYKLQIQVDRVWTPSSQRQNDKTIMDLLIEKKYPVDHLRIMNKCRLYLQVIYLSDIVSADGKTMLKWASHATNEKKDRSTLVWPYQQCPTTEEWNTWKMTLYAAVGVTTNYKNTWFLHHPLGP